MPRHRPPGSIDVAELGDELSTTEAAQLLGVHVNTIRRAINAGTLEARVPMGRDPRRAGRLGYRISRPVLLRWYAGATEVPDAGQQPPPG